MPFVRLGDVVLNLDRISGIEKYPYDGGPAIKVTLGEVFYRFTLRSDPSSYLTLKQFMERQMTLAEYLFNDLESEPLHPCIEDEEESYELP